MAFEVRLREFTLGIDKGKELLLLVGIGLCSGNLAALFLLYLLECLEEELFDITALIQNHLTEGLEVLELASLEADGFAEAADVLALLLDNLLALEAQELLLLFEVGHDLAEALLKQLDLGLEHLDLIVLFILLSCKFLHRLLLLSQVFIVLFIFGSQLLCQLLGVIDLVLLQISMPLEQVIL